MLAIRAVEGGRKKKSYNCSVVTENLEDEGVERKPRISSTGAAAGSLAQAMRSSGHMRGVLRTTGLSEPCSMMNQRTRSREREQ